MENNTILFFSQSSVTQVGANWNQLITELSEWQKLGREVLLNKIII